MIRPRIGPYTLVRRIAIGRMAELFLARASPSASPEQLVVLKRLPPAHAQEEVLVRMFLAEARLTATLDHPNIVQVHEIGQHEGVHFFTMEYLQGAELGDIVRRAYESNRALRLEHVLDIVLGIAGGLDHAHEKTGPDGEPLGIVHRDVSPSNVLVTWAGEVKIIDFGIAKTAAAEDAAVAGTLKGRLPYMSPEQCRGEPVDRRSDIFSIGTLLWELSTGKRLFGGHNALVVLDRVARGDVPRPTRILPDYPPELERIVMEALQADPDRRCQTALELRTRLETFAHEAKLPVSSEGTGRFLRALFAGEVAET